jgi:alpha-tubulin suppressor-like RCC1 family protein
MTQCRPRSLARALTPMLSVPLVFALACDKDLTSPAAPPDPTPDLVTANAAAATPVFRQVSAGDEHTCAVAADNRAYCWGRNNLGQLGDGTFTNRFRPVPVAGNLQFRVVSAGYRYTCGLTTDDRAFCWGTNAIGQLGDGTTTTRKTPVVVTGGRLFHQLDAGVVTTCAVASLGRQAYCWGGNGNRQLGNGGWDSDPHPRPLAVAGNHQFQQVTVGEAHSCGITTANEAFCWGIDISGELGNDASQTFTYTPVKVATDQQIWSQIDAGSHHTCAFTEASRVFCWGRGTNGQIGDGHTLNRFTPRLFFSRQPFSRVTGGFDFTCAENQANEIYCSGRNNFGQFGDGSTDGTLSPALAYGGRQFSQFSAGAHHTCGVTSSGQIYCAGNNSKGQLGNGTGGTGQQSTTPVLVANQ